MTLDEGRRRTAVLEAIGDDWDPIAVLAEENKAYDMLYSDLDEEQQRIYNELVGASVPEQPQLRQPLAVPTEQPGHAGASAVPDMRLSVVDRHP